MRSDRAAAAGPHRRRQRCRRAGRRPRRCRRWPRRAPRSPRRCRAERPKRVVKKAAKVSETPATRFLRGHGVEYTEHVYDYVDHGGTAESARQLGVAEHEVVKTLVMQTDRGDPFIVLMHGDRNVVTRELARAIGVKSVQPCTPARRPAPHRLHGRRHVAVRNPQAAAGLCRGERARAAAGADQRRPARLPGRHRARACSTHAARRRGRCTARRDGAAAQRRRIRRPKAALR